MAIRAPDGAKNQFHVGNWNYISVRIPRCVDPVELAPDDQRQRQNVKFMLEIQKYSPALAIELCQP